MFAKSFPEKIWNHILETVDSLIPLGNRKGLKTFKTALWRSLMTVMFDHFRREAAED